MLDSIKEAAWLAGAPKNRLAVDVPPILEGVAFAANLDCLAAAMA